MAELRVLYLVPDLIGPPGGIARHSRITCQALLDSQVRLSLVALHDRRQGAVTRPSRRMDYRACEGRIAAFVLAALMALRQRPDIILLGHPHFTPLGWFLARAVRARCITFMHGVDVWSRLSQLRRLALRHSDRCLAVSHYTARRAIEANDLSPKRVSVLHNCLDPQFPLSSPPSERTAPNPATILTVARILPSEQYKGHDVVIRALAALLQRFPNLVYDIVGDGCGQRELAALAEREGVSHAVRFHGAVSDEELARHYATASIFVMPSRREGFGLVFLEAMARGLPVIAGKWDASVEVVRDGETGFLVDPTSVEEIGAAIARLLANPSLRARMGTRGREVVAEAFSFERFTKGLLVHLSELTG